MASMSRDECVAFVRERRDAGDAGTLAVPLGLRLLSDQLTPVVAYRRLVSAPSSSSTA